MIQVLALLSPFAFCIHAQSVVYTMPYSTGFESGLGEWTAIDYNADGHTWNATPYGTSSIPAHNSSSGFVGSSSFVGGANGDIAPDDFLVSPRIAVTSGAVLSWWHRVAASGYPADHYSVYISTTGSTTADFLATTPVASITPTPDEYWTWIQQTVDLTPYIGDTITIAFRHHDCFGQFAILLDDISIDFFSSPWTVADTVPWSTNFDTPDSGWTFVGRINGWYIGAPGALNGSGGLYVSGNGGATRIYNRYNVSSRIHWAVRPLHFNAGGEYRIDYDWMCNGYWDSFSGVTYDFVRVFLAPMNAELDTASCFGLGVITSFTNSLVPFGWISLSDTNGEHLLSASENWVHHAQGFTVPGAGDYLLLILAANGSSSTMYDQAPAIDNLSLAPITCPNTIDTLRFTANSNQGITVNWHDEVASQWAVYVNDSLYGTTSDTSFFLPGSAITAATCDEDLQPTIGVSPICSAGDTALAASKQAEWTSVPAYTRTVTCSPFTLPYTEDFDSYLDDGSNYLGWYRLGSIGQYIENTESHSGSLSLNMRAYTGSFVSQIVVTPQMDAPGNRLMVSFWAKFSSYNGAASDTVFQVGVLFDNDTMDHNHVAAATHPMLSIIGSNAGSNWQHYQFTTDALADTLPASITFNIFNHGSGEYKCYLDDIEVVAFGDTQDSVPPVVMLDGPVNVTMAVDTALFTSNLLQGDTTGLTYIWHSSLMDTTLVTISPLFPVVYNVVGVDTITLVATNLFGSDTATLIVTVEDNLHIDFIGATTVYVGDTAHFRIVPLGGDTVGLSYTWHSTLLNSTSAAASWRLAYPVPGTDTLTVTVTNAHGPHLLTRLITVLPACGTIASFPYLEDFEGYDREDRDPCWLKLLRTGDFGYNNWYRNNRYHSGTHGMSCNGNLTDGGFDAWLIMPAIDLPAVDTMLFEFFVKTSYISDFNVLVSPSGDTYYDAFTDTLYTAPFAGYDSGWDSIVLSLEAYRGRHIRVAFVHAGPRSQSYVSVDDIAIRYLSEPDTSHVEPHPDTVWRTVTVNANVDTSLSIHLYGSGVYLDGDTVEIGWYVIQSAEESDGHWQFLGWSDVTCLDTARSFVVTSDTNITAFFEWIADTTEIPDTTESINELSINYQLSIYPNPSHGDVTISVSSKQGGDDLYITVLDLQGRAVIPLTVHRTPVTLHLNKGTYFVKLTTPSGTAVKKLIIH